MRSALAVFEATMGEARHLTALYDYLSGQIAVPYPFDDLLRSQVVQAVSAFDKLMHDIIRIGMRDTYIGLRPPTNRYNAEPISLEMHGSLLAAVLPPAHHVFEIEVSKKLRWQSFQRADAVAEGLALIWNEKQKWDAISVVMGSDSATTKTKLNLYANRRNAIVHESDMDPMSNKKTPLSREEARDITDFVELCGQSIVKLVI